MKYRRIRSVMASFLMVALLCSCSGSGQGQSMSDTGVSLGTTLTQRLDTDTTTVAVTTGDSVSADDTASPTTDTGQITVGTTNTTSVTLSQTTSRSTTSTSAVTTTAPVSTVSEMRGAWISYVELSSLMSACSTPKEAKAVLDTLMDNLADARINTVFFHVRANSDAYYPSNYFKTASAVGKLVQAGFDPLAYAVEAAHKRSMQLHAWVNPYRIGVDASYIVKGIPTFQDAAGLYYYVPTDKAVQALILNGIRELLNNYDIDGIQYDDYFYPEGLLSETAVYSFESADYNAYQKVGGQLSIADWRRAGVDALVSSTYTVVKSKGKTFGISPSCDAEKNYTQLYADSKKWLREKGYVDYLCPQIYVGFEHSTLPFEAVVNEWLSYERHNAVKLCVGLGLYKIGLKSDTYAADGKTEWSDHNDIMKRSVQYLRSCKITGIFFYSSTYFDPATCPVPEFKTKNQLAVAKKEIQNLLSVL